MKLKELLNVIDFENSYQTEIIVKGAHDYARLEYHVLSDEWLNAKVENFDIETDTDREKSTLTIYVDLPKDAKRCEYVAKGSIILKDDAERYLKPSGKAQVQFLGKDEIYHRIIKVENGKVYTDNEIIDMHEITHIERLNTYSDYWHSYRLVWDY